MNTMHEKLVRGFAALIAAFGPAVIINALATAAIESGKPKLAASLDALRTDESGSVAVEFAVIFSALALMGMTAGTIIAPSAVAWASSLSDLIEQGRELLAQLQAMPTPSAESKGAVN